MDVSKLTNPPRRAVRGRSILDEWLDALPDSDRVAVMGAVTNPAWGHVALLEVLIEEGAPHVADTTFQTWRRKMGLPR